MREAEVKLRLMGYTWASEGSSVWLENHEGHVYAVLVPECADRKWQLYLRSAQPVTAVESRGAAMAWAELEILRCMDGDD